MEADELKKKKEELRHNLQRLINDFSDEVGNCEIRIRVENTEVLTFEGKPLNFGHIVSVDLTV